MDGNDRQNIEYHLKTIEKDNDVIKTLNWQIIFDENVNTKIIKNDREIIKSTLNPISRNNLFYDQLFKLLR